MHFCAINSFVRSNNGTRWHYNHKITWERLPNDRCTSMSTWHELKVYLHWTKVNAKVNFLFHLCHCLKWNLNRILCEPIRRRCRSSFRFCSNINEPFSIQQVEQRVCIHRNISIVHIDATYFTKECYILFIILSSLS